MKLEPLMTFRATMKPPAAVGAGPFGTRQIMVVTGGEFEGPRLRGKVSPSGGDWVLFDNEGIARLDVRVTLETHDGALLYVQYHGILEVNDKIQKSLASGTAGNYGDSYFFTTPRIETGDSRYTWLNRLVTVADGRVMPSAVEYRVSVVHND